MKQNAMNAWASSAAVSAIVIGFCLGSASLSAFAQDEVPSAVFVKEVDREDLADISVAPPTKEQVLQGLLPEALETPDKREERERCERLILAKFKCMPPARSYTRYSIPGVSFAVGSAVLPDLMRAQLQVFAEALRGRKSQQAVIRVDGHADASGNEEANMVLSQRRAQSVRDFLVSLGASPSLFMVQGFGSRMLRNSRDPTASENRRVEIARNLDRK